MLGAQSVLRFTNASAETTASFADSIHNRLVKACPLFDQTRFKFVDVSYSGQVNFLLQCTPDAIVGKFCDHSVGEMKSGTFHSRKASWKATVHSPVERQNPTLQRYPDYVWQQLLGKKIVAIVCSSHFDTRLDKMDFSAAINKLLFNRYAKISTFVFDKVML